METTIDAEPEFIDAEAETIPLTQQEQAEKVAKTHILWAMGGGLIPIPLADIAAIMTVQVRLVTKMSEIYDIPFSEHRVKNIVTPLVTSVGIVPISAGILGSLVKTIPVFGTAVGIASMPLVAGATTYAISRVFISHFEAGGNLLDLDPKKMKAYYAEMFDEGKKVAQDLKKEEREAPAAKAKP